MSHSTNSSIPSTHPLFPKASQPKAKDRAELTQQTTPAGGPRARYPVVQYPLLHPQRRRSALPSRRPRRASRRPSLLEGRPPLRGSWRFSAFGVVCSCDAWWLGRRGMKLCVAAHLNWRTVPYALSTNRAHLWMSRTRSCTRIKAFGSFGGEERAGKQTPGWGIAERWHCGWAHLELGRETWGSCLLHHGPWSPVGSAGGATRANAGTGLGGMGNIDST